MKIVAFSHAFFQGGAQVSTLEYFELLKKFFELKVVVCNDTEKEFIEQLKALGIEYRSVPCFVNVNIPDMSINAIEDWLKWSDVAWITDIEFLVAPRIKRIKNVPVIAHLHSYPLLCPWWGLLYGMREVCHEGCSMSRIIRCKQLFNRELAKLDIFGSVRSAIYQTIDLIKGPLDYLRWRKTVSGVINSIDGFIAVSNFVKRVHEDLVPINGKPIEVVYNPVTYPLKYAKRVRDSKRDKDVEKDLVVYASGSNPVKGPHLFLQAIKMLLDEGEDIKFVMLGCKDTWVEKYASKLKIEKNVSFMGRESFETLYKLMFKAKTIVMPSIWPEPFGRVPVEANRLGTMAVVTNRGGLPEIVIPNETGYIVDPYPKAIAQGILYALKTVKRETIKKISLNIIDPQTSLSKLVNFFHKFY